MAFINFQGCSLYISILLYLGLMLARYLRMELYSAFDKKIGHFRRYYKKELKEKVLASGFEIEEIRYHEILGYLTAYYNRLFAKAGKLNASAVKIYDKAIVPMTNFIEKFVNPLIGKSLFVIAVKPQ